MEVHKIAIVVEATSQGVGRGLAPGLAALTNFQRRSTSALERLKAGFAGLSGVTKVLGGIAIAAALIATALGPSIRAAIEFESAFAGVRKTVAGTPGELASIRSGLLDMSRVMPTTASELASIAENAGQLGVAAPDVLEFTRVVAQLGETTDLDFDSAAQSLARFLNITGTGASGISRVADVLVELGNTTATTESQIVDFATRLASSFTVAGATEDQILAIAASFSSLGLRAEAGGSALARIITSISDAARGGSDNLRLYAELAGLTTEQFSELALSQGGAVEALLLVGDGLRKVLDEGRSLTPILDELGLGGLRTSEAMRLLALSTEFVRANLEAAENQFVIGGAAQVEYARRTETTAARLDILANRINALAIELGTPLLAGFAAGVDAIGDAIERTVDELRPLGAAVGDTFRNMADALEIFLRVIGAPVLKAGVATLLGLSVALTAILEVINALGPAGLIIGLLVADIALVGPVSAAAAAGLTALGFSVKAVQANAVGASVATRGLSLSIVSLGAAVQALALGALVVGLFQIGRAYSSAGSEARRAGDAFNQAARAALENESYSEVSRLVSSTRARIVELEGTLQIGESGWTKFKTAVADAGRILTTGNSQIFSARRELDALRDGLDDTGLERFDSQIRSVANSLGLTEQETIDAANAIGVLDALVSEDIFTYTKAADAVEAYAETAGLMAENLSEVTGATTEMTLAIVNGTATTQEFFDVMGVGAGTIDVLARLFPELSDELELVFSDDQAERARGFLVAIDLMQGPLAELAEQAGLTREAFEAQIAVLGRLADSYSVLQDAVNGALDAMALITAQEDAAAAALENLRTSFDGFAAGEVSIRDAAGALREYIVNLAATGAPIEVVTDAQRRLRAELIRLGVDSGLSYAEAARQVDRFGGVTSAILADLVRKGQLTRAEAELLEQQLIDMGRQYDMELFLDGDQARAEFAAAMGLVGEWQNADLLRVLNVDEDEARAGFERAIAKGTEYKNTDFTALAKTDAELARAGFASAMGLGNEYKLADYTALAKTDPTNAMRGFDRAIGRAGDYTRGSPYTAEVRALTSSAEAALARVRDILAAIRSKTVTVQATTVLRTASAGPNSPYYPPTTSTRSRGGGTSATRSALGDIITRNERAGVPAIYRAVPDGTIRQFAERQTGDEAFIPLAPATPTLRDRAVAVLGESARRLGVSRFQEGGIATSGRLPSISGSLPALVSISAPVQVSIEGRTGLDAVEVGRVVERSVASALERAGRDIANRRVA